MKDQCLPIAFAKLWKVPYVRILQWLGHNGSEILWPELPEPNCYRSFHIEEFVRIGYEIQKPIGVYNAYPMYGLQGLTPTPVPGDFKVDHIIPNTEGVALFIRPDGSRHAEYYNRENPEPKSQLFMLLVGTDYR